MGRLWVDANRDRVHVAATYAAKVPLVRPGLMLWLKPSVPFWGMTTRVPELISNLRSTLAPADDNRSTPMRAVLVGDDLPKSFERIFNAIVRVPSRSMPRGLEILLVPGRLAFLLAHSPIGVEDGYPVPMGLASFDAEVVRRVHQVMTEVISAPGVSEESCDWQTESVLQEIDDALDASSVK